MTKVRVLGQWAKLIRRGPEQSLIKWDGGREAIIPNSWIEEEKGNDTETRVD